MDFISILAISSNSGDLGKDNFNNNLIPGSGKGTASFIEKFLDTTMQFSCMTITAGIIIGVIAVIGRYMVSNENQDPVDGNLIQKAPVGAPPTYDEAVTVSNRPLTRREFRELASEVMREIEDKPPSYTERQYPPNMDDVD